MRDPRKYRAELEQTVTRLQTEFDALAAATKAKANELKTYNDRLLKVIELIAVLEEDDVAAPPVEQPGPDQPDDDLSGMSNEEAVLTVIRRAGTAGITVTEIVSVLSRAGHKLARRKAPRPGVSDVIMDIRRRNPDLIVKGGGRYRMAA